MRADQAMSELLTTHESTVTPDQIDHLGHMNVRFYAVNAQAGTQALLATIPGWGDRPHIVHDVYTRHHREQLLGTPLAVRSAVVGAGPDGCACTTSWRRRTPARWRPRSSTGSARWTRAAAGPRSPTGWSPRPPTWCSRSPTTPPPAPSRSTPT
jgi:hypothetical protein